MRRIDPGYPKNISQGWGAVRYPVGAVMSWNDGNTYFFKGLHFSKYEFRKWHLYRPQKVSDFFFKCNEQGNEVEVALKEKDGVNGVLKTTVFAPLIALLAIFASLCNW